MSLPDLHLDHGPAAIDAGGAASRCLDILVAATALLVFAPVMLAIAAAIWFEGGRPVFFAQTRLGRGGHPFTMYKFRKFSATAGTNGCPLTMAQDQRMTGIGRILAASKLDELPQLWNVLRGDMAVVGPRPESMAFADCFRGGFEQVLDFKPGLLGPSQIQFRNECRFYPADTDPTRFYRDVLFPAKARLDLTYFPHRTLVSDIGWIVRGVLAVLGWTPRQKGAAEPGGAASGGRMAPESSAATTRAEVP
jgi:lipopolysaccharide/colanic/teichoic acid biosynthesis glycosyltransferase